jgi:hypothetical protein
MPKIDIMIDMHNKCTIGSKTSIAQLWKKIQYVIMIN